MARSIPIFKSWLVPNRASQKHRSQHRPKRIVVDHELLNFESQPHFPAKGPDSWSPSWIPIAVLPCFNHFWVLKISLKVQMHIVMWSFSCFKIAYKWNRRTSNAWQNDKCFLFNLRRQELMTSCLPAKPIGFTHHIYIYMYVMSKF